VPFFVTWALHSAKNKMKTKIDLTGQRFGRLTVIEFAYIKNKKTYWRCKCDCGGEKITQYYSLKVGYTKSCGCLQKEKRDSGNPTHGNYYTRLYKIWSMMKSRCYNKNTQKYKDWGGRGITVCNKWLDYLGFKEDMQESYDEHLKIYGKINTTIDRIDNDGNYELSNCQWATQKEQQNNRRNNKIKI